MSGRGIRLARLFSRGRAVIVAADHGEFDGPIPGLVDLPRRLAEGVNREVDGLLLSPGMVARCRELFSRRGGPLAVVRLNWSTVYAFHWGYQEAATVPALRAREAAAAGAEVALVSLTLRTGSEERDARNVQVFCELANEAHALGLPVVGEVFPARVGELDPEELHDQVRCGARIVAELGADLVKTFHTHRFPEVVEGCPLPILALGAEKTPTQLGALQLAAREIADGAQGVVFGRNALQVPDPRRFQAALCAVVREGLSPEEAVSSFEIKEA